MKEKHDNPTQNQVFSHPIRKLNIDELEKVVGGNTCHYKNCGWGDNQGRDWA